MKKDQTKGNSVQADPSDDFFAALEDKVNGAIQDTTETVSDNGPEQATQKSEANEVSVNEWESDNNPYKKRYSDSSREAKGMNEELTRLKPFVPLLDAMRKDGKLVNHVKDYLINGGPPAQSVQDKLNLKEDFTYDPQEAMTDQDSDSAKVLNAHVDQLVQRKVKTIIDGEKAQIVESRKAQKLKSDETAFKEKHNMTDEEFTAMVGKAKEHKLTLEDIYFLMNKDKANANVANNTKQDMMNQMKNMKDMPSTVGATNSAGSADKSEDDQIFDSILGSEQKIDSLFG